jgi:hypothetical protein
MKTFEGCEHPHNDGCKDTVTVAEPSTVALLVLGLIAAACVAFAFKRRQA